MKRLVEDLQMFECMCGAHLVGTITDYDQHLTIDCPVYAAARAKLQERYTDRVV